MSQVVFRNQALASLVDNLQSLAIALGLGLLVGLQREWRKSEVAGIRTFALTTLFGALAAHLAGPSGPWVLAAGFVALSILMFVANLAKQQEGHLEPGMTTEIALLMMFGVGAAVGSGYLVEGVVTGGLVAVLLHWKQRLHGLVRRLAERDVRSVMQLALIGLVILPVLPDESFGPYHVLNPFRIWLMVVLIVGISLSAYVAYLLLGSRVGSLLGGVLGGLISSTATTVSYARQTQETQNVDRGAALVIVIASMVVNIRILVEIGVAAPGLLATAIPPFAVVILLMAAMAGWMYRAAQGQTVDAPEPMNPTQLRAAVMFGLLYAVIILLVAAAKHHFGERALYPLALLSGLTDVDALTLSSAHLAATDVISASTAWRVILLATLSNLGFKLGAIAVLGSRPLLKTCSVVFGVTMTMGLALILCWPAAVNESSATTQPPKPATQQL